MWTTLKVIAICISCDLSVIPTAHMVDLSVVQLLQFAKNEFYFAICNRNCIFIMGGKVLHKEHRT